MNLAHKFGKRGRLETGSKVLQIVLTVMVFASVALATVGCDNDDITEGGWVVTDNGGKSDLRFAPQV